jgi:hypothetical protein
MQASQAKLIAERWGDKPCDHPGVVKEYMLGAQTGDRICTQCGFTASPEYFENLKKKG